MDSTLVVNLIGTVKMFLQTQTVPLHTDLIYQFHQGLTETDQVSSIMEVKQKRTAATILAMDPRFLHQRIKTSKCKTIINSGPTVEPTLVGKVKAKWISSLRKILEITPISKIFIEAKLVEMLPMHSRVGIMGSFQLIQILIHIGKMPMISNHHKLSCTKIMNSLFQTLESSLNLLPTQLLLVLD